MVPGRHYNQFKQSNRLISHRCCHPTRSCWPAQSKLSKATMMSSDSKGLYWAILCFRKVT